MKCNELEEVKVNVYWKPTGCKRVVEKGDFVRFCSTGFRLCIKYQTLGTIILASLLMEPTSMILIIVGELITLLLVPVG